MGDVRNSTVTFLFTDIESSTRQWEETREMAGRLEQHFIALHDAIDEAGGEVFSDMGDGVLAAFTSAESALRAAIDSQQRMHQLGLKVRIGINTGEAERVATELRGRPLNRAARIMAVGHGGQILVSDVTATLLRTGPGSFDLVDLGPHRLRDLSQPERIWQVNVPGLDHRFPPLRGVDTYSNNLPTQRSLLIGRERDARAVGERMRTHRIVTLTGVGGVGKTRLALQVAADALSRFSNAWLVELAGIADPDDVADAVALTIGAGPIADPLNASIALLQRDPTLLVIDNCEHVVDQAAALIDALTAHCPTLSVIATSREALGIDGEYVMAVSSLDPATTAIELFAQRAASAGADLSSVDRKHLEHICERLDGLPLAIELAAARAATLGVVEIIQALDDRFSLLSGGRRRAVDRHATMRATIDWSYRLLDPDERRLFQWLSVFSSGFELDTVRFVAARAAVAGSSADVERSATDLLESLVHKSMLRADHHHETVRYDMLETMRAFALEQLEHSGDRHDALSAQAQWVTTLTDLPFDDPCNSLVERNAIRLEREADNWRDATMFAAQQRDGELARRLCGPSTAFFLLGRHDLADFVAPLIDFCDRGTQQRMAVLTALVVSGAGAATPGQLRQWSDEISALDIEMPTGVGSLMRWLTLAWQGEIANSIEICLDASNDERLTQATRDMFVGIAVLDRFSLTEAREDPDGLIERALEVAERSDVAIHRVTCLLGAAWGSAHSRPDRSVDLVRWALREIPNVPALTRLTLPGSASRLLAQLDPRTAARGLLEQLEATPTRRSFVDLIPVFYATALLHRVGHRSAGSALATLTVTRIAPYFSMMDFVDLARRASSTSNVVSLSELETLVREALHEIATGS